MTNRQIYARLTAFCKTQTDNPRTLEEYLCAALLNLDEFRRADGITPIQFCELVESSFTTTPANFDISWQSEYDSLISDVENFSTARGTLIQQIVDLREMQEAGQLANELRYFGIESPRKTSWFNFDPCTYVECGLAGSIDGWEPSEDSSRQLVSGQVAMLDESGKLISVDARDIEHVEVAIDIINWKLFTRFLWAGSAYE